MRKQWLIAAAASLAIGGMAWAADPPTGTETPTGTPMAAPSTQPTLPEGVTRADKADTAAIQKTLSLLAETATSPNKMHDLVGFLDKPDRDRLNAYSEEKHDDLLTAVQDFNSQWKDQYKHSFEVQDFDRVYSNQVVTIQQGEITNPALMSNWPVTPTQDRSAQPTEKPGTGGQVNTGGAGVSGQVGAGGASVSGQVGGTGGTVGTGGQAAADNQMEKGREVAVVTFPAEQGLPAINASMVREGAAGWKIDIPNNIDGPKLKDNLIRHLDMIKQQRSSWPADEDQARRLVTHHVLMALYDVNAPAAGTGTGTGTGTELNR